MDEKQFDNNQNRTGISRFQIYKAQNQSETYQSLVTTFNNTSLKFNLPI